MALSDWNWRHPVELQDVAWDCACASVAWALQAIGREVTEAQVVQSMYPTYVNEYYGLLDASGAGLVEWLAGQGVQALNNDWATWADVTAAAGHQPMVIGGRTWCHWSGVRIWSGLVAPQVEDLVALANPAPGWGDVDQTMNEFQFTQLGPFSAVWFASW